MRLLQNIAVWFETWLRARRYASAQRPAYPAPAWIAAAESFSLMDANPMAPIAAATVGTLEQAGQASRMLLRYALEIQAAADSLESTRKELTISDSFVNSPEGTNFWTRRDRMALAEQSLLSALERQRRSLSDEREALCLLAGTMRRRLGRGNAAETRLEPLDRPLSLLRGSTLLSYFASIRRLDAVEALLEMGASPDAPNQDGATALSIASRKAEGLAGARPGGAAGDAARILSLLEAKSLADSPIRGTSKPTGRI